MLLPTPSHYMQVTDATAQLEEDLRIPSLKARL